ncbi:hypothetical protein [Amycolatopsis sp. NPDC051071]|uniref:hypothetical protein n=1 Tax=Amycolatopsis sp. NPDC051071 TaxID=3154637 RepID=UPI003440C854
MSFVKKTAVTAALTGAVIGGALLSAAPSIAAPASTDGVVVIQGTCGDTKAPSVNGGAAGWTITCAAGKIRVQGWVKDTDADGKAAEVYGTWGYDGASFGTVRAGGEGTKKTFDKAHKGSTVYLYLRVI